MSGAFHYLAAFAVMLGVLILVHELGHFCVARLFDVKVLRFSIGFGRPLYSLRLGPDRTEWAIGAFPLGGYVKMLDEREGKVETQELPRSFSRQTVWRRVAIVVAGPLANLLLATVVYWGLFWHGTEELKPILGTPVAASPAAAAGIENGEQVRRVGGKEVRTWPEMRWVLLDQSVERDSVELEVINRRNEISLRRLDVSSARENGWQDDFLQGLGITLYRPSIPPVIGTIAEDGAAFRGGLRSGDRILSIDEAPIADWAGFVRIVRDSPGRRLAMGIERGGERTVLEVTPDRLQEGGSAIGRIGAGVEAGSLARSELMTEVRYGVVDAFGKAVRETWEKSEFSLVMIGKMIVGEVSWRNVSGPLTIADYAGQSARLGADRYLSFLALVSVSLAVLNLLPVPMLDGGHLLYYFVEIVRGKPLSEPVIDILQQVGMAIMLMLMALAFYNDFNRLIPG